MVEPYKLRDRLLYNAPEWLQGTNGYRLLFAIGTQYDALVEAANHAVRCRYPGLVDPVNSLPRIGKDRKLRRGLFEGIDSYSLRLKNHLDVNRRRGLGLVMLEQLKLLTAPFAFDAWIVHNRGTDSTPNEVGIAMKHSASGVYSNYETDWHWDDTGDLSRFWVILSWPTTLLELDGYWGDPGEWGDGGYWGVEGSTGQYLVNVQTIIQDFAPAHMKCEAIITVPEADIATFWASPPDGDWDRWENRNPIALYS